MFQLEARGLVVTYGYGKKMFTAVHDVDLAVPKGGTLGLVGESGCGKSTIARAVVGLVPIAGGRLFLDGQDVTDKDIRERRGFRRRVQIVFQDPYSSLNPRLTVAAQLADALATRDLPRARRRAEAARVLDQVGLGTDALDKYPHQFSGGQRQRIAIARALTVGPEVLLLDEVTSSLDVSVQATILNLLRDLQARLGLSYLFISHDLSTVRSMSDVVSVMYLGEVVETGQVDELFRSQRHPYTRSLIASVPQLSRERQVNPLAGELPDPHRMPSGCRFHTRCPIGPLRDPARTICKEQEPARATITTTHWAACHFAVSPVELARPETPRPAGPARDATEARPVG